MSATKGLHIHRRLYSELDSKAKEFRLLTVEPGRDVDPLVCSLLVISFDTHPLPAYETVSYHWGGSQSKTCHVESNGRRLPDNRYAKIDNELVILPLRAEQAVRCMRLQDRARTLWIDSICINQDEMIERQQQIALMGEIFRYGTRNLVHLGIDERGEAVAAVAALRIAKQRLTRALEVLPKDVQRLWHENRFVPHGWEKQERPPILLDDPRPLQTIFRCAWFTRLWVIQETCLATENICHWGNQKFNLLDLLDVVQVSRELDSVVERTDAKELIPGFFNVQQLRYSVQRSHQFRSANFDHIQEAIMDLVHAACSCKVTESRDRVYGLVGLFRSFPENSQASELLRADYDKPLEEVFRDATRAILMLSQTDDLLAGIRHRYQSDLINYEKPSWSYYYDRPVDLNVDAGRTTFYTSAHAGIPLGSSKLEFPFTIAAAAHEPDILCLRGMLIGGIEHLTQAVPFGSLVNDAEAMTRLIDGVSLMARAQHNGPCSRPTYYGQSKYLGVPSATDLKTEALRLRERAKAYEAMRRRSNRRLASEEIAAIERQQTTKQEKCARTERNDSHHELDLLGHSIDMTTIAVLTNNWWSVQHKNNEQNAVQAFRDLRQYMRQNRALPYLPSEAFNMSLVISGSSNLRRFFTTEAGYVGSAKEFVAPGDQVAVFIGAKCPYILRPSKNDTYRLVDMTVIPAIMHGEAFELGLQEQEFRIC